MKRLMVASASALTVAILAACTTGQAASLGPAPRGGPSSSSPPRSSPSTKPTTSPHPSPTQHPSEGKTFTYQVWFEQNGKLFVTGRTSPFTLAVGKTALTALLAGPSSAERAAGVTTAIPSGSRLLGLTIVGGVATVDLSSEFRSTGGASAPGVAQVVYTITQYSNVKLVVLRAGGLDLFATAQTRAGYTADLPAILVESPLIGAVVSNPVTVSGTANVFEATVSLRILDENGNEIARTFTQATCGTACRGTFSVAVSYRVSSQRRGTIEVYESSAKDGSPINVARIPVTLTP
jgi:hypothetical protein